MGHLESSVVIREGRLEGRTQAHPALTVSCPPILLLRRRTFRPFTIAFPFVPPGPAAAAAAAAAAGSNPGPTSAPLPGLDADSGPDPDPETGGVATLSRLPSTRCDCGSFVGLFAGGWTLPADVVRPFLREYRPCAPAAPAPPGAVIVPVACASRTTLRSFAARERAMPAAGPPPPPPSDPLLCVVPARVEARVIEEEDDVPIRSTIRLSASADSGRAGRAIRVGLVVVAEGVLGRVEATEPELVDEAGGGAALEVMPAPPKSSFFGLTSMSGSSSSSSSPLSPPAPESASILPLPLRSFASFLSFGAVTVPAPLDVRAFLGLLITTPSIRSSSISAADLPTLSGAVSGSAYACRERPGVLRGWPGGGRRGVTGARDGSRPGVEERARAAARSASFGGVMGRAGSAEPPEVDRSAFTAVAAGAELGSEPDRGGAEADAAASA